MILDIDIKVFKLEDIFGKYLFIFSKVLDDVKMKFIKIMELKVVILNIFYFVYWNLISIYFY